MNERIISAVKDDKDKGTRRVSVIREPKKDWPQLYLSVFMKGDNHREEALMREWVVRSGCYRAESPDEADFVIFGGGADVNPKLYGEERHPTTFFSETRDATDIELYNKCFEDGIPMLGICRGAQFIHVMNGGKLYQDVDGHQGDHSLYLTQEKRIIPSISSVHHQMCISNDRMTVLGESSKASRRILNNTTEKTGHFNDVEAYFYRDIMALGFQGHPEYRGYGDYSAWCLQCIEHYIVNCPDLTVINSVYRIKPDVLAQRAERLVKELM